MIEMCPHYKIASYESIPICDVTGDHCYLGRRCIIEKTWLPLNSMYNCRIRNTAKGVGMYKVRFEKGGKLYVEMDDMVVVVDNVYEYTPETVDIKEVDGIYYIDGFEPKKNKKKIKSVNKKNSDK